MRNDDDDEDETASMHLVFLLLDTLHYLTLPDLHMSFDPHDDASFRLQCRLRRYLSIPRTAARQAQEIHVPWPCTCTCSSREEMRKVGT